MVKPTQVPLKKYKLRAPTASEWNESMDFGEEDDNKDGDGLYERYVEYSQKNDEDPTQKRYMTKGEWHEYKVAELQDELYYDLSFVVSADSPYRSLLNKINMRLKKQFWLKFVYGADDNIWIAFYLNKWGAQIGWNYLESLDIDQFQFDANSATMVAKF